MEDLQIRVEYTGNIPNMRPAASAFARMIRNAVNTNGVFTDPDLEAEFQQWLEGKESPRGDIRSDKEMPGTGRTVQGDAERREE